MEYHDIQGQRGMRGLDLVLWPEVQGNAVFPSLELFVELSDGVEKLAIRLLRSLYGVQTSVHFAADDGKLAHQPEEVDLALAIG